MLLTFKENFPKFFLPGSFLFQFLSCVWIRACTKPTCVHETNCVIVCFNEVWIHADVSCYILSTAKIIARCKLIMRPRRKA